MLNGRILKTLVCTPPASAEATGGDIKGGGAQFIYPIQNSNGERSAARKILKKLDLLSLSGLRLSALTVYLNPKYDGLPRQLHQKRWFDPWLAAEKSKSAPNRRP